MGDKWCGTRWSRNDDDKCQSLEDGEREGKERIKKTTSRRYLSQCRGYPSPGRNFRGVVTSSSMESQLEEAGGGRKVHEVDG